VPKPNRLDPQDRQTYVGDVLERIVSGEPKAASYTNLWFRIWKAAREQTAGRQYVNTGPIPLSGSWQA